MKLKNLLLAALFLAVAGSLSAQKIKVKSGDLSFLKGQDFVKTEYTYDNMAIGKFDKEEDYVNKKVAEYNEKEAGKGDKWAVAWKGDRDAYFHPKFEELLNNYTTKYASFGQRHNDTKYTMITSTTFTEPGFNIGIVKKDAMIDVEISFVETANPDNVLAVMVITGSPGRSMDASDYLTGLRIAESYAKCGKELGKYLVKKAFK